MLIGREHSQEAHRICFLALFLIAEGMSSRPLAHSVPTWSRAIVRTYARLEEPQDMSQATSGLPTRCCAHAHMHTHYDRYHLNFRPTLTRMGWVEVRPSPVLVDGRPERASGIPALPEREMDASL